MARTVRDAKLETRTARARLAAQHEPYWRSMDGGRHIGYRKGVHKASWLARLRTEDGRYKKKVLGLADDTSDADGTTVLSYTQAQAKARTWFTRLANGAAVAEHDDAPQTLADVMNAYLDWYKLHRKGFGQVESNIKEHVIPKLGAIKVADLNDPAKARALLRRFRTFHHDLATAPARVRTRKGEEQKYRKAPATPDQARARKATANKILTGLKAALNQAYENGDITTDAAWRQVTPFRNVDAPKIRFLSEQDVVRLIAACDPEFRPLAQGAVLTGCRYGELTRLKVSDFNAATASLYIAESKSGKARTVYLTDEGARFFAQQTAEKTDEDLIFSRANGDPWKASQQARPMQRACGRAGITPAISFHILRHCYGSRLAMQGVSMKVIADQLGHSDTRITERHYAHLSADHVAETVRGALGTLGVV